MKMKLLMNRKCATIILAAGESKRMGQPKFALPMPNGNTFLENITIKYAEFGCQNIVVVLNKEGLVLINKFSQNLPSQTLLVLNPNPDLGRFSSIKAGLKQIDDNYVFIHNVDNPFANAELLKQIYDAKKEEHVIKPIVSGRGGHPVLISRKVIDCILIEKENNLNFKEYLKKFQSKEIVVHDETISYNINTYDEYLEFYRK